MVACDHCTPCAIRRIEETLTEMRTMMANETEQLGQIKAAIADVHADVRARLDRVRAEVSPEGQAEFDSIKEALSTFDAEIGDADGSDTPTEPTPDQPADPFAR